MCVLPQVLPLEDGVSPTGTLLADITTTHAGIVILEKLHALCLLHAPIAGVAGLSRWRSGQPGA